MSTREIQGHLEEIYKVEVSPTLISNVTEAVMEEVKSWQSRSLDSVYPIVYVCPGTLAQQWFAELYSKFCGRIFTMLDLRKDADIRWDELKTVIVSTTRVAAGLGAKLSELKWDLVVFDEAHYLLGTQYLYDFALNLSSKTRSLLLLSALPAQRREDEFLPSTLAMVGCWAESNNPFALQVCR
jgi:superfamily II DNA or RNA helicase